MARYEVSDELWARIQPLLPVKPRRSRWPGRLPLGDRACLNGILFVLLTGISWVDLPQQLGYGSGMTCWRRLRDWTTASVWDQLHALLLAELHAAGQIDWSRAAVDGSHVRAKRGDEAIGPSPVDRARPGSKHHLLTDGNGIPLAVSVTGGNRNDITQLIPLLDAIPPVRGKPGRPRRRPSCVVADRGYDHDKYRRLVKQRGVWPVIGRRGVAHGSGLGAVRWVVERSFAWLHAFKRLAVRWEYRADIHCGFLKLAVCLICWRYLGRCS